MIFELSLTVGLLSDVVLKTGLSLKTNFLRSWSWPWTVLRIWKIAVLSLKRS